ncbi:hypothetical protein NMG29_06475 [Streptomyces cocklensis]|uniref:Uncharacterized protein n=1 Tax=Actinacidiphila cocklensis TaxID=887465 RepID=A0A9W4DM99_9ACTN|nr:hypothetical protein [Actinacidiphila cocklensis]MDD1057876.1 hypothetical protein [Actinacidiphila cocklensis]CAG6392737.1 hypothetical protein SCOCK_180114 [Actinacidiphila cocklensis]
MKRRLSPPCQTPEPRHSLTRARLYPSGWECDRHAPWARKGLPEPLPGPGWPSAAWTTPAGQGVASLIDERAIARGKRRASQTDYRAAQAAVTSKGR